MDKNISRAHPMHIVLIADDSGSMSGEPAQNVTRGIQNWILELQAATRGTRPYFRFTLITFGSQAEVLEPEAANVNELDYSAIQVDGSSGTTNMAAALHLAQQVIARDGATDAHCPPFVFLYTDGAPDDDGAAMRAAAALKGMSLPCGAPRLITLGFGDANEGLLKRLATSAEFYKHCKDSDTLRRLLPAIGTPTQTAGAATVESFMHQIAASSETNI